MKTFPLLLLFLVFSCATREVKFDPQKTCSQVSLNYIKTHKQKRFLQSQEAINEMQRTQSGVQACYEAYTQRGGPKEFDTCLVIAYDPKGKLDFWELSSKEAKLDAEFVKCSNAAIGAVPFWKLGKNYILLQSYHFYKD